MDKTQAQEFISNVFQSKFDPEQYALLVRNLLNNFEHRENNYQGGSLWEAYREHISQYRRIGKYTDPNGDAMDILIVEVKSLSKLDRARTSLRNFVVKHLQTFEKDYAIAAFYSKEDGGKDWRFSFVKIEIESERTEEGKIKARKELTPAKRYSFLVGAYENSYTAQKQLLPLLLNDYSNPTIEDIENTFSIEKVTDEFFEQYKELYLKLSENKDLSEILVKVGLEPIRFTKKLLGQIVFLYFLQKKGWLGVPKNETWGKGDKKYMQNLFNEALKNDRNYFKDYLQYLFYEALAKDRRDTADPVYYRRFDCKIPFLNGGLFEADYDWEKSNIVIPNNLFRNEEKNKAGDRGTGIFDVFDRYNFTIKEDEPLEKEVAVDPEMLGKVFENMLEIKERKSKGAYYTPREIVHYMCQESLINYIDKSANDYTASYQTVNTEQLNMFGGSHDKKGQMNLEIEHKSIKISKKDIELFIRKGYLAVENDKQVLLKGKETDRYKFQLPESIQLNADLIDEKLTSIKICDPAIGSGAFPVGLLHELVIAQKVLLPFLSNKYLAKKLEAIELNHEEYKQDPERYVYKIKRHTIQESIYGVDIDASAIDIARLRLWLSLIVDETDFYNIEALPNLDYKIVQGDSLVGFPEDWKSEAFDKIERLKEEFFDETDTLRKKTLKAQIDKEINDRLKTSKQVFGYEVNFDFKLFFSEVWHYKKGFDIVIGNPPFVTKISPEETMFFKSIYKTAQGKKYDLFRLFIEKSLSLLSPFSNLSFIVPDVIMNLKQASILRKFIIDNYFLSYITLAPIKTFDASVIPVIIGIIKDNHRNRESVLFDFINLKVKSSVNQLSWYHDDFNFNFDIEGTEQKILNFINNNNKCIKDEMVWKKGLGVYSRQHLLHKFSEQEVEKIMKEKPWTRNYKHDDTFGKEIEGKDVHRYCLEWNGKKWLSYGPWLAFQRPIEFFRGPRILVREIMNTGYYNVNAAYEEDEYFNNQSIFNGILKPKSNSNLKYILGLINSKLFSFYAVYSAPKSNRTIFPTVLMETIENFKLPNRNGQFESTLVTLVDYLILLKSKINIEKSHNIIINYFSHLIDGVVYELYFQSSIEIAKKEICRYLRDLKAINDNMSDEEKLAIIQAEFNRLYDPNHPVRNNLETLDSVEEVRIIKESLK